VAVGRVFLKNAPVLLLDEPFSGLDADAERLVRGAIESYRSGRTVLTVTHRLADIHRADRIEVLEDGRVIESGGLDELLAAGGPFQRLAGMHPGGAEP
jgi:ABC-type multidrug transport system fused ATPase/permease subunit